MHSPPSFLFITTTESRFILPSEADNGQNKVSLCTTGSCFILQVQLWFQRYSLATRKSTFPLSAANMLQERQDWEYRPGPGTETVAKKIPRWGTRWQRWALPPLVCLLFADIILYMIMYMILVTHLLSQCSTGGRRSECLQATNGLQPLRSWEGQLTTNIRVLQNHTALQTKGTAMGSLHPLISVLLSSIGLTLLRR